MPYGLTSTGFTPKPYEQVLADIEASLRSSFGESIDLTPQSTFGQIAGIIAERVAEVWDAAQGVYAAFDPDAATGTALDALAAVTGTLRLPATKSTLDLACTGTPGTVLPAGRQASVDVTLARFETLAEAVIAAATAWASTTAYVVGAVRTNASRVYVCTGAGTSAGSGGPTTTAPSITDGTVTWRYVGEGTGYVAAPAECTVTGPVAALSGTITTIETPVSGWSSVRNLTDAVAGRDVETDAALRLRREGDLQATGGGAVEQIREALSLVDGVLEVTVFENATDSVVDSIPPHAVEALVLGGDADDIRAALFAAVAAGIATFGSETGTVVDSMGISHTVEFSRPTPVPIYFAVALTKDPNTYPADGDAQVKAAMVAYGATFRTGWDVRSTAFVARIFTVPGVLDVTECFLGTAPAPTTPNTVTTTARELATFDSGDIVVVASNGSP
jgi:uncharacterized phage protein gp47/JayE